MKVSPNIASNWNSSFFDAFEISQRDPRLDDFPFMSAMWPTVYMWLAYPILHVVFPRGGDHCERIWNVVTALKFFMASVIFTLSFVNLFLRCESDFLDSDPRSPSYQVMLSWYLHYVTCLAYHQVDIFVYTHTANYHSAIARGMLKSFNPLYMWMHTRYFPHGPDTHVMTAVCFGHILKEGFNLMEIWKSRECLLGRQIAATFQIFVVVCSAITVFHSFCCILFLSDYDHPCPWQLIVINMIFLSLLMVLYMKMYLMEFVTTKMK